MNKFEKCKTCNRFNDCEYLKTGNTCHGKLYSTSFESTFDCVQGKTIDIDIKHSDCDIRLDLIVEKKKLCKLWGQVKDKDGNFIDGALVSLLKPQYVCGKIEYFPVATTISDCSGFYQFEIDQLEKGLKYKVTVSKN